MFFLILAVYLLICCWTACPCCKCLRCCSKTWVQNLTVFTLNVDAKSVLHTCMPFNFTHRIKKRLRQSFGSIMLKCFMALFEFSLPWISCCSLQSILPCKRLVWTAQAGCAGHGCAKQMPLTGKEGFPSLRSCSFFSCYLAAISFGWFAAIPPHISAWYTLRYVPCPAAHSSLYLSAEKWDN